MSTLKQTIKQIAKKFNTFTERGGGITMRRYQLEPAKAIIDSIVHKRGLTFVVIMSRQAGKDELISNLMAYLCNLFAHRDVGIVVANPTYKPQTINAIMRFEKRLSTNLLTKMFWSKRSDFMRMIGQCIVSFLSADASANVVGATASLALIINEAQDVEPATYDKKFVPMVASTNATRIICGTVWTSKTLLARETRAALQAEKADGIRRVFLYTADNIRKIVPAYGQFIDNEIKKLGRQHPLIKTQYFCEEIDELAGMFNARRLALMQADREKIINPGEGAIYAMLIDVGGQDEALINLDGMGNPGRDYTTLSIVEIDLSTLEIQQAPTYRTVHRNSWHGDNHVTIFSNLTAYATIWNPLYIVIDATGVGEGLWAMLAKKYRERVLPVKFTQQTKSEIGYGFIGIIETGRFKDCAPSETVREQYENCESEILIGPQKTMRWGVKDGSRSAATRELIHDDYITADALTAILDKLEWYISSETTIIESDDVLQEMDHAY